MFYYNVKLTEEDLLQNASEWLELQRTMPFSWAIYRRQPQEAGTPKQCF